MNKCMDDTLSRREVLGGAAAVLFGSRMPQVLAGPSGIDNSLVEYGRSTLPAGIRSRRVDTHNDVTLHILEAGFEVPRERCIVLLHGFPELAYTWRRQLLPLARAGFHVIAPDARGYG